MVLPCGKIGIILVVDQVDHGMLQHLARLGEALHSCRLGRVELGGRDLNALLQGLGEHGRAHALGTRLGQLLVHVWNSKKQQIILIYYYYFPTVVWRFLILMQNHLFPITDPARL